METLLDRIEAANLPRLEAVIADVLSGAREIVTQRLATSSQGLTASARTPTSPWVIDDAQAGPQLPQPVEFANPWHDEVGKFAPKGTGSRAGLAYLVAGSTGEGTIGMQQLQDSMFLAGREDTMGTKTKEGVMIALGDVVAQDPEFQAWASERLDRVVRKPKRDDGLPYSDYIAERSSDPAEVFEVKYSQEVERYAWNDSDGTGRFTPVNSTTLRYGPTDARGNLVEWTGRDQARTAWALQERRRAGEPLGLDELKTTKPPREMTDVELAEWAKSTTPYPGDTVMAARLASSATVSVWADTSSDHNPLALRAQEIAAENHGLSTRALDDWGSDRRSQPSNADPVLRSVTRAEYAATQEYLAGQGISEITVYRGYVASSKFTEGQRTTLTSNPLTSWTVEEDIAANFAGEASSGRGQGGAVFQSTVPAAMVQAIPFTGRGCLSESEVILLGMDQMPAKITQTAENEDWE